MLILQNCTDSPQVQPSSSSWKFPASSDGTYDFRNIKVEGDIDEIEEVFIAINKELDIGIKQEEIPGYITFPEIKAEPEEVSYVCVCILLETI
jgi:hypothetical protein